MQEGLGGGRDVLALGVVAPGDEDRAFDRPRPGERSGTRLDRRRGDDHHVGIGEKLVDDRLGAIRVDDVAGRRTARQERQPLTDHPQRRPRLRLAIEDVAEARHRVDAEQPGEAAVVPAVDQDDPSAEPGESAAQVHRDHGGAGVGLGVDDRDAVQDLGRIAVDDPRSEDPVDGRGRR